MLHVSKHVTCNASQHIHVLLMQWLCGYLLIVTLTHIDLHAWAAEVPQSEGRVLGRCHHQSLGVMSSNISQLLIMT